MTPTQDPAYTAGRLIRRSQMAGKPMTFWLGPIRNAHRQLIATNDPDDLVKALPRESLTVNTDMRVETLTAALIAIWDRLQTQIPAGRPIR